MPRARWAEGMAMVTTEASRTIISCATAITASARNRRGSGPPSAGGGVLTRFMVAVPGLLSVSVGVFLRAVAGAARSGEPMAPRRCKRYNRSAGSGTHYTELVFRLSTTGSVVVIESPLSRDSGVACCGGDVCTELPHQRADARRNRAQILQAAETCFAE